MHGRCIIFGAADTSPDPASTITAKAKRPRGQVAAVRKARLLDRAERSLKRKLRGFFLAKAREVTEQAVSAIDEITRADEEAERRARRIAANFEITGWNVLVDPTAAQLAAIYESGVLEAMRVVGFEDGSSTVNEARARLGLPAVPDGDDVPAIVRQVNERSVDWARRRAAELVTQISENTRDMLRVTIIGAIEEGWSATRLADEIEESAAFSADRAEMISRTELINANNEGNISAYRASGVVAKKEWLVADAAPCDICIENADAGPIDIDDLFPDGSDGPSAHPNCRCAVSPVVDDEAE